MSYNHTFTVTINTHFSDSLDEVQAMLNAAVGKFGTVVHEKTEGEFDE